MVSRDAFDGCDRSLTPRQFALQEELVRAIRNAIPPTHHVDEALRSAEVSYEAIAVVLVALRHEFTAADGKTPDLRGRSRGYREIVHQAYAQAGANGDGPIEKRLTAGVSYWVRKLLIERYGEEKLRDFGVLPVGSFASVAPGGLLPPSDVEDPVRCMLTVVDLLNRLATDPTFVPSEDIVRSAARAVVLLQHKLTSRKGETAA